MADDVFSENEWRLWRDYVRLTGQLNLLLDRHLQHSSGLSQADIRILAAILGSDDGRLRAGELADALAWEKSRVSHQVARMERRGLVVRTPCDDDLRGTWVQLSERGLVAVRGAMSGYVTKIREYMLDHLSEEEAETLSAFAQRALGAMGAPEWPNAAPFPFERLAP